MSSSNTNKNGPYKKYQCRYFDERGRPLSTPCNQGSQCRFVHPEDPQWPGLKCHPIGLRRSSGSQPSWVKHDTRKEKSPRTRRSSSPSRALVSQNDLFRRCKRELEEQASIECNDDMSQRKDSDSIYRDRENHFRGNDNMNDSTFNVNKDSIRGSFGVSPANTTLSNFEKIASKDRSDRFISVIQDTFQDVATLSSHIIQDTILYDQEERKLQTFQEISETLSKISTSSAATVAGPIADMILAHAQSKERLDENFRLLGAAWERVFNSLMNELAQNMENRLQTALESVKKEAESAMDGIKAESSQLKRRISHVSMSPEPERQDARRNHRTKEIEPSGSSGRSHSSTRESKRRKVASRSRSRSPQRGEVNLRNAMVKISLDDILSQMKMKIDQQNSSLQVLSKENEELKYQLHSPPRAPKLQREVQNYENGRTGSSTSGKKSSSHSHESDKRHGHSSSSSRHNSRLTDSKY